MKVKLVLPSRQPSRQPNQQASWQSSAQSSGQHDSHADDSAGGGTLSDFTYMLQLLTPKTPRGSHNTMAFMPLALPTLAALTPRGVDVSIIDENVEDIDFDDPCDVVGISFVSFMAPRAYAIAEQFRSRGVHVVLGGVHATTNPDEAQEHADTVVIGEAEETWPQFIADFARGDAKARYQNTTKPDLRRLVIPRWDLVNHKYYLTQLVQTTRGCSFNCDFCTIRALLGAPRWKPVEHVIAELRVAQAQQRMPGSYKVMFADDNIISNVRYAKDLFRAMIPLELRWSSQLTVNIAQDDQLLELAKQSGCDTVLIGFESISQENLESINKARVNKVDVYRRAIEKLQSAGINIYAYFIFGLDHDDASVFERTVDFIQETGIEYPLFNILTPIPGTRLYDTLAQQGRLRPVGWDQLNGYNVCYEPKKMTGEELSNGFRWAISKAYSQESISERVRIAYDRGSLKAKHPEYLSRAAVTAILLNQLRGQDFAMKSFIAETIKSLWTRPDIKINALLMFLDRFEYAHRLQTAAGPPANSTACPAGVAA